MTAPLLSVRGVKTFYGNIMALKGVDLDVNDGEIVTLIGANGAGKSTLMMTICGNPARPRRLDRLRRPRHHADADARDRAARIAQAPEGRRIFPRMTVLENLQMGATDRRPRAFRRAISSASSRCSRSSRSASTSAAARCPAASSRCWRSRAR